MDSTALNVLVKAQHRDERVRLALLVPESSPVRKVFEVTKLDGVFDIRPGEVPRRRNGGSPTAHTESGKEQHV